ncbi:MAG: hypothetical protein WKF34_00270 [Pyrinomonadaceae bacterium]
MPTKYDTNPLDEDFPERVKAEAEAEMATRALPNYGAETRGFMGLSAEEQTRRLEADPLAYQAPFTGHAVPAVYAPSAIEGAYDPSERKVDKIGLPENILTAVPYIPWYLGLVASLIILLVVPKHEAKVRFHAAQGMAAHLGIFIVSMILGIIDGFSNFAAVGSFFFNLVTSIMLVVFAIKAWKGKPVHIESVEPLANWLEEKIGPIKT